MRSRWFKNGLVYLLIIVAVGALFFNVFSPPEGLTTVPLTEVAQEAKKGNVKEIVVSGDELTVTLTSGEKVRSNKDRTSEITEVLRNLGVTENQLSNISLQWKEPSEFGNWIGILTSLLPAILFGGLLLFMMRQAQSGNNQALSFGKSRARL
ncbi:MAG: ATP-dependent metallopeptidase FtsH/Yme1/Tma family protein, partial [Anaerolineae bacterium]